MADRKIGLLHPGAMGASVGAAASGDVYWASAGRSDETAARAEKAGLTDAGTAAELARTCQTIVSVCPPHAAEEVAAQIAELNFTGVYLDANAISPDLTRKVARIVEAGGASFVDGGIVGGPAWRAGTTRLYLSGDGARAAAECFAGGPLETVVLSGGVGAASALKMAYAAYTKGTTALISAVCAVAEKNGVREALEAEWSRSQKALADGAHRRVRGVTAKAWRFAGEMEQIADTFEGAGLPGGFHRSAAELYRRIAHLRERSDTVELGEVLAALLDGSGSSGG